VRILTEPRNALVRQYKRMFEIDDVELEFTDDALTEIAALAVERKTGARGLRAILEEVLGPIMFDIPSRDDVAKVEISAEVVRKNAAPSIVPREEGDVPKEKSA
jgi:ATP-dependent Clp protease ATP-binding subunit ClpX